MRVAHFVQRYPPALGGSEAYFARLSRSLVASGHAVTVLTSNALDLEAFWSPRGRCLPAGLSQDAGVEVCRYPLWRFPGRRFLLKALSVFPGQTWQALMMPCNPISWRMWRDAGRGAPDVDVVHATAFPYAWPIACGLRLARRRGVPFFLTPFLHLGNPDDPCDPTRRSYTSPALLSLVHAAERVFVQTDLERNALLERGVDGTKLVLQGMGVDPAECTGGDRYGIRARWGAGRDEVTIGHLANKSVEKGSVDLLRAAAIAWKRGASFRLVLAGPEMPSFTKFWGGYRAAGPVVRLGVLAEQEKRDFFAGLDIFALPSRSDSFGLVLLEAWANGLPNVGYRAGGVAEVIRHQVDGLLATCGNVEELAECLCRLIGDAELRRTLGEAGRKKTVQEFTWKRKLDVVRREYERVMSDE